MTIENLSHATPRCRTGTGAVQLTPDGKLIEFTYGAIRDAEMWRATNGEVLLYLRKLPRTEAGLSELNQQLRECNLRVRVSFDKLFWIFFVGERAFPLPHDRNIKGVRLKYNDYYDVAAHALGTRKVEGRDFFNSTNGEVMYDLFEIEGSDPPKAKDSVGSGGNDPGTPKGSCGGGDDDESDAYNMIEEKRGRRV